jgi:hypothetical protein
MKGSVWEPSTWWIHCWHCYKMLYRPGTCYVYTIDHSALVSIIYKSSTDSRPSSTHLCIYCTLCGSFYLYLSNVFVVVAGIDPTANTIYRTQHSSSRTENIKVFAVLRSQSWWTERFWGQKTQYTPAVHNTIYIFINRVCQV